MLQVVVGINEDVNPTGTSNGSQRIALAIFYLAPDMKG